MVQPLPADVVGRVDHDATLQRAAVLGEQRRHYAAGCRQQHDVGARDRIGDRDSPGRLRRPRRIDQVVTGALPRVPIVSPMLPLPITPMLVMPRTIRAGVGGPGRVG